METPETRFGHLHLADDELLTEIAVSSSGDARSALNTLELAASLAKDGVIDRQALADAMQRKILLYDKSGEEHFNLISALHKSVRSSDPDAALYWLARMMKAGEDRLYLARRLIRMAIEDIGLADPRAVEQAMACHADRAFSRSSGRRPGISAINAVFGLSAEIGCGLSSAESGKCDH